MLLTPAELADLTGYKRPSAQVRWLKANGWPFQIGGDGLPKVLRRIAEARLGSSATPLPEPRLRLA